MSNEYPFASMRDSFDLSAYFVVGPQDCKDRPLTEVIDQALHGGATFIQLRAKGADASELTEMARDIAQIIEDNEKSDSVAFVIDDRADVVWQGHQGRRRAHRPERYGAARGPRPAGRRSDRGTVG